MALDVGDPMGPNATVGSVLFVGTGPELAQDNANLYWDNTGKSLGIGTTSPINGLTVSKAVAGGNLRVDAINTSTSAGSNAWLVVSVAGATAGDPIVIYDISGVRNWAAGIDNSDADKFKIASSAALGTNDRLTISTTGVVDVPGSITCPLYSSTSTLTVQTEDKSDAGTSALSISTGDVTAGNGSSGSGTVTIQTGTAQPNSSGTGSAGNSGTVTLNTGGGGSGSNGSASGASGNLLLKTGSGGANSQSSGGPAGHIILQPGNGGSGTVQGAGGSTVVRASNSGDILAVQNSAGTTTHFGVANDGNVRVGAPSSTARLHLGAGTSTLPPLKLTSGTLLSTPQAGAVEFDGVNFYVTQADGTRRSLILEVANVRDFGAVGDGMTDDSAAFQAAVDSLVDVDTGGVVWIPPNRTYVVGDVTIAARYPVHILSEMNGHIGVGTSFASDQHKANIVPAPGVGATHVFKWDRHADLADGLGAGGGIRGVMISDTNAAGAKLTTPMTAAVCVRDAQHWTMRDCIVTNIKGRGVKVDSATVAQIQDSWIQGCGDTGAAQLGIGEDVMPSGFAGVYITDSFFHASRSNVPAIRVNSKGGGNVTVRSTYFENNSDAAADGVFIDASGGGTVAVDGCVFMENVKTSIILNAFRAGTVQNSSFNTNPAALPIIEVQANADHAILENLYIRNSDAATTHAITCAGDWCTIRNLFLDSAGAISMTGGSGQVSNIIAKLLDGTTDTYYLDLGTNSVTNAELYGTARPRSTASAPAAARSRAALWTAWPTRTASPPRCLARGFTTTTSPISALARATCSPAATSPAATRVFRSPPLR